MFNGYVYYFQAEFQEKHRRYFDFQRRTGQLPLQEVSQNLVQPPIGCVNSALHVLVRAVLACQSDFAYLSCQKVFGSCVALFYLNFNFAEGKLTTHGWQSVSFNGLPSRNAHVSGLELLSVSNLMVWHWTGGVGRLQERAAS